MSSLPPAPARPVLPSSRKQNIACDQCRTKKIRCLRASKTDICEQCNNRGSECTSDFIDSLAHAKPRKPRKLSTTHVDDEEESAPAKKRRRDKSERHVPQEDLEVPSAGVSDQRRRSSATLASVDANGECSRSDSFVNLTESTESLMHSSQSRQSSHPQQFAFALQRLTLSSSEKQQNLIRYLLSPYPVTSPQFGFTDLASIQLCQEGHDDLFEEDKGRIWNEAPSAAHLRLDDDGMKDLTEDLIETFLGLVHPRHPVFEITNFRRRFSCPDTHPSGPVPLPLLAVIIAWGARLSEHPVILADSESCSADEPSLGNARRRRSAIVSKVVIRARDVVDVSRICRIPTMENAQALVYLESLLGQSLLRGPSQYQRPYIAAAVRHIVALKYDSPPRLLQIEDLQKRQDAVHLWWVILMMDGFGSVFGRLKPCLYDEDCDFDPTSIGACTATVGLPPTEWGHTVEAETWFSACQVIASICRCLCRSLWVPRTAMAGIDLSVLKEFVHQASVWRDAHLSVIGAPVNWPESWDFLRAITACTVDCYYHTLWLVVNRAVEDFGIAEEKRAKAALTATSAGLEERLGELAEIGSVRKRIEEESEHAAMRVAALTGVLTENGYLKLDPLIIDHPIYEAGRYLSTRGRHEYLICAAGLRQFSLTFPAMWDQADELDQAYANANASANAATNASVRATDGRTRSSDGMTFTTGSDRGHPDVELSSGFTFGPHLDQQKPIGSGTGYGNGKGSVASANTASSIAETENGNGLTPMFRSFWPSSPGAIRPSSKSVQTGLVSGPRTALMDAEDRRGAVVCKEVK